MRVHAWFELEVSIGEALPYASNQDACMQEMTSDVDKRLREALESIPSEKFDEMMSSRFKCFFCREPSCCLAVLEWEGKEV